ncbi:HAMP domain-containing protein [Granulicella sp. 5B5]|nr:HAMP domain-containing protein [Granulicella sp. 5B5]
MLKGRMSISLRLTLWFGGAFFAVWVLFGVSMWANLRGTLTHERHQTLSRRLERLQDVFTHDQAAPPVDRNQDFIDFAHATGNGLMEVFRPDGTRAFPSPSEAAMAFPWPQFRAETKGFFVSVPAAGQSYWVLGQPFLLAGQHYVLMAAAPDAGNVLVVNRFLWGLLAACPVLLLISSGSGYWISRRALQPVSAIADTARSISIGNISERIPVSPTGDELQRLAETCNAMLDRLESSVNQIKRFTADASHELRGPLSFTRTVAEIAIRNPAADPESRQALLDIVDETAKATVLLEDMLALARADSLPVYLPRTPLNLSSVIREVCEMAQPLVTQHGLTLLTRCEDTHAMVLGDPAYLKRMLWILLDNAIKYSRTNGVIEVHLSPGLEQVSVIVRDTGIGISQADLPFIFDRFYRADPSRCAVEGSGLGLAIAKWIAEAHEARISVVSEEGAGTSFTVAFPESTAMPGRTRKYA